jgi:hypothetical protein
MNDLTKKEAAYDPQELERLLVERENAGDVDGMTALFAQQFTHFLPSSRLLDSDRKNASSNSESNDRRSFAVIWL